jgi:hypothetical protein
MSGRNEKSDPLGTYCNVKDPTRGMADRRRRSNSFHFIIHLSGRISGYFPFLHMTKTTQTLTRPALDTIVKPVHVYDEEQKEKLQALREVRPLLLFTSCL